MADLTVTVSKVRPLIPSMVVKGTMGGAATVGNTVRRDTAGDWVVTDASTAAGVRGQVGVLVSGNYAETDGAVVDGEEVDVVVYGRVGGFSTLDETVEYYLSDTAAKISDAKGTAFRFFGYGEKAGEAFFVAPHGAVES